MVGVHVQILAPFHHALQNGHETLQAFLPQTELLEAQSEEYRALPHFTVSKLGLLGSPVRLPGNH